MGPAPRKLRLGAGGPSPAPAPRGSGLLAGPRFAAASPPSRGHLSLCLHIVLPLHIAVHPLAPLYEETVRREGDPAPGLTPTGSSAQTLSTSKLASMDPGVRAATWLWGVHDPARDGGSLQSCGRPAPECLPSHSQGTQRSLEALAGRSLSPLSSPLASVPASLAAEPLESGVKTRRQRAAWSPPDKVSRTLLGGR